MKGSAKELVIMVISIVFVLSLVIAGVYFYFIESDRNNSADAIMSKYSSNTKKDARNPEQISADLERAKADLAVETIALRYYRAEAGMTDYPVDTAVADSYTLADNAANKTNAVKDNKLDEEINIKKAKIKQVLEQWKKLIDSSTKKDINTIKKEQEYAKIVKSNIEELKIIVNSLTPESSDLSQSQIENYQTIVDDAVKEINNSVSILEIAQSEISPDNSNNQNSPDNQNQNQNTITPEQIQEQQNITNRAQAEVIYLENELNQALAPTSPPSTNIPVNPPVNTSNTDSGSQNNSSTYTPPPVNTNNSGKPQLIEGMNPIN